jgi:hypothetical protein
VPGRAGRLDTVSRIASVRLGVDLVALLEGHQIVRQTTAVLINEEPFVGVVVLTREESAPVTGSAHDKDPHRCVADSRDRRNIADQGVRCLPT